MQAVDSSALVSTVRIFQKHLFLEKDYCEEKVAGQRAAQGRVASSCAARRKSVASSPNRPTKCVPTGSPSAFQNNGTDIAGWPVTLQSGVKGTNASAR
jgi:hypothetical protein